MTNPVFIHTLTIFGSLFFLILLVLFLPILFMVRKAHQRQRDRNWLEQHGTHITASVKYVIDKGGGGDSGPRSNVVQNVDLLLDVLDNASPQQFAYDQGVDRYHPSASSSQYQITAQWVHPRTRKVYLFQQTVSSRIFPKGFDPRNLSEVTVLIDFENPKHYVLELPSSS